MSGQWRDSIMPLAWLKNSQRATVNLENNTPKPVTNKDSCAVIGSNSLLLIFRIREHGLEGALCIQIVFFHDKVIKALRQVTLFVILFAG